MNIFVFLGNFRHICDAIIQLLVTKDDKYTMQDAYIIQSLWTVENTNKTDCDTLWKVFIMKLYIYL